MRLHYSPHCSLNWHCSDVRQMIESKPMGLTVADAIACAAALELPEAIACASAWALAPCLSSRPGSSFL